MSFLDQKAPGWLIVIMCIVVAIAVVFAIAMRGCNDMASRPHVVSCRTCIYGCEQAIADKKNEAVCVDYCVKTACSVVDASTTDMVEVTP